MSASRADQDRQLNPVRLSAQDAARVLGVDVALIERDLDDGLPANSDGTLNLVSYAAWLNMQLRQGATIAGEPTIGREADDAPA